MPDTAQERVVLKADPQFVQGSQGRAAASGGSPVPCPLFSLAEAMRTADSPCAAKNLAASTSYDFLMKTMEVTTEDTMKWLKPSVCEVCVGMEVTSYESAEIDPLN
jgi:coenzyme PQQ precursor peptide PqqA